MRIGHTLLMAFVVTGLVPITANAQIEVKELTTRKGVTLQFIYARAENPVASAILFQGGGGNIGIFPNGSVRDSNFLSGGAGRFIQNGISVVIPDVPSDRRNLDDFRNSAEHAQDNAALIEFLRQQSKAPVWAIGTSNGSLSAASMSTHLKEKGPDGLVLTSTVTKSPRPIAHSVHSAPLDEIKVPVLLVHHKEDGCRTTPYVAMPALIAALKSAKPVELISVEGGSSRADRDPCHTGHHQFFGIEATVTGNIAEWINRYQSRSAK